MIMYSRSPQLTNDQRGMMSFITVMLLAIVLSVITTGFIRTMVVNQRQTTDQQLSTQAFYAAETGVQDAVKYLAEVGNPGITDSDCSPSTSGSLGSSPNVIKPGTGAGSPADIEYTCQMIKTTLLDMKYAVKTTDSTQVHLNPGQNFNQIEVKWHINAATTSNGDGTMAVQSCTWYWFGNCVSWGWSSGIRLKSSGDNSLPINAGSNWNYPGLLRTLVVPIASGTGSTTRQEVLSRAANLFFMPASNGSVLGENGTNSVTSRSSTCDASAAANGYVCTATITLPMIREAILRLRMIYRPANVQITLRNTSTGTVIAPGQQAEIDVTGRANNVYRRIRVRVPLSNNTDTTGIPEYAIESAEGLCKQISVGTGNNGQGVTDDSATASPSCKSVP